ncbi:DNA cytosine methyltransferase [Rodentibacter pneumotropicus]|nr:DNA cytosine methyltransferase [Rodentibacter pneumotropicus]
MFPQNTSRKSRIDENRLLRTVRTFTSLGNDVVYNIEVADDNSYIVNNAVVHNCQAFSVAGKRESLNDDRGNLTLALIHILEAIDYVRFNDGKAPCVLVWENVPGVLSTKDNAFGHFLAGLAQETEPLQPTGKRWTNAGYVHGKRTVAWRILDAQHFGVAQRRKRVFVVASARTRSIAQILIEQKGVSGNIEPSRQAEQGVTAYVAGSLGTYSPSDVGGPVRASGGDLGGGSETFIVHGTQDPIISQTTAHCLGRNGGQENVIFDIVGFDGAQFYANKNVSSTLRRGNGENTVPCIALTGNTIGRQPQNGGNGNGFDESGVSYTLTSTDVHAVANNTIVRKLTPIECERLQGFPDNYTKIPYRNKSAEECPDSPRYKALGNSMAVPVMRWIGKRLVNYLERT